MWNFPGAFYHYSTYKNILSSLVPSIFYDGTNLCKWNGGRNLINQNWSNDIVYQYYKNNHKIALTFSNSIIDLSDKTGNYLLSLLNENNNYVICKNINLAKYIKEKYQNISLIYSITGTQLNYSYNWYKNILSTFDYIVPRWHHIKNISKDFKNLYKFEIMVNHSCPSTCKYWDYHYKKVELDNINNKIYSSYNNDCIECLLKKDLSDSLYNIQNTVLKLNTAIKLGFTNFKLAGREFSKEQLIQELNNIKKYIYKS